MGGIFNTVPSDLGDVDVIIVGGGSSGCVVAARLSDAHPALSILVIERGKDNYDNQMVHLPLASLLNILTPLETGRMMLYPGQKEESLAGRDLVVPAGSILGGGSSTNMLTYTRGVREDMDDWNTPGWTADEMIQYLKKCETYHGQGSYNTHGRDGPIHISDRPWGATRLQDDIMQAAVRAGVPETVDAQDLSTAHGAQRNLLFTSPDGKRSDAAHAYLHPRLRDGKHENLHVLTEHQVTRALIEGGRAVGVEVQPTDGQASTAGTHTIKARKMVVLTAGNLGSPLLLERSGVGQPEVLAKAGVSLAVELPGVGENFQDHNIIIGPYYSTVKAEETLNSFLNGKVTLDELVNTNHRSIYTNGADMAGKLRPSEAEVAAMGPAFQNAWDRDFKNRPNKPVAYIITAAFFPGPFPEGEEGHQFISATSSTFYPYSRGSVHITGPSPADPIALRTGILSDPEGLDVKQAAWHYKKQREVMRRLETYRGEYAPWHPPFAASSPAACGKRDGPLPADVGDIVYSADDDAVLDKWVRENVGQCWHSCGTCSMAPLAEGGVVDGRLGVHGVAGLRIADLSVVPVNYAANMGSFALAVGERAAAILIEELEGQQ